MIQTSAVGMNLEDGTGNPAALLTEITVEMERLKTVKQAAAGHAIDLVLNARTDTYLDTGEAAPKVEDTIRRAEAYLSAGADCIFVIGILDSL
jgi:2-methylisocitrate lyase-like PEP mutase family enzyme